MGVGEVSQNEGQAGLGGGGAPLRYRGARRLSNAGAIVAAAALIGSIAPAAAGPADRALAALLSCDATSMARIASDKAALGPAKLEARPGSRPGATYELDEATFAAPVEASGLHLTGFVRYVVFAAGKPRAVSFAFKTREDAPAAAKAVGALMKDVERQQEGEQFGFLVELEPEWHTEGDGSAIEHRSPLRMVLVTPSGPAAHPAAMIECELAEARIGTAPPPKLADVFAAAPR